MKINTKTIIDSLPGLAVGAGIAAVLYYVIVNRGLSSHHDDKGKSPCASGGKCGSDCSCKKDPMKHVGRSDEKMDKHNRDMKLGASGYRRVHNRRGTIQVGNKRREVTMDDGFDPSAYDYETLYGDPKIVQFSYGGLSI